MRGENDTGARPALTVDESTVLAWFTANGWIVDDYTLLRVHAETRLPASRVFACIVSLAEKGLLRHSEWRGGR